MGNKGSKLKKKEVKELVEATHCKLHTPISRRGEGNVRTDSSFSLRLYLPSLRRAVTDTEVKVLFEHFKVSKHPAARASDDDLTACAL